MQQLELKHKGTKPLETQRLVLRKFSGSDDHCMFDNWASDPDVSRYMTWPYHASIEQSRDILALWLNEQHSKLWYNWAIVLKESGEPIGSIGIININDRARSGEIGYCIGKRWWHKGIMSEAFRAVRDYMFDEVGLFRLSAKHCVENPNSGKVMLKCGMLHEGSARKDLADGAGNLHDSEVYGMLCTDVRK